MSLSWSKPGQIEGQSISQNFDPAAVAGQIAPRHFPAQCGIVADGEGAAVLCEQAQSIHARARPVVEQKRYPDRLIGPAG